MEDQLANLCNLLDEEIERQENLLAICRAQQQALLAQDLDSKLSKLENPLTKREREIVTFLFHGLSNRSISCTLNISEKTVKSHLQNIFKKMKVSSRTQVISSLVYTH